MTIIHGFMSFNTTAPASRIAPLSTVTPGADKGGRAAAADWSRWPAGTVFRLLSTGQNYRVEDYGWALSGRNTIDLYMANQREMAAWKHRVKRLIGAWRKHRLRECGISTRDTSARYPLNSQLLKFLRTSAGKFRRRMMRLEAAVPAPGTLQRLAKAGGRWQFKRLTWRRIELPNYRLLKIT